MLSRLSWDVGSRRALTPPRANRETGVSAPGGERPCRNLLSSPSSSTTPRTSRASPVGAARPPSDRAISFEAVFAASRPRGLPPHARRPRADLTSSTSGHPQASAQSRHAAQADGAVEIAADNYLGRAELEQTLSRSLSSQARSISRSRSSVSSSLTRSGGSGGPGSGGGSGGTVWRKPSSGAQNSAEVSVDSLAAASR